MNMVIPVHNSYGVHIEDVEVPQETFDLQNWFCEKYNNPSYCTNKYGSFVVTKGEIKASTVWCNHIGVSLPIVEKKEPQLTAPVEPNYGYGTGRYSGD